MSFILLSFISSSLLLNNHVGYFGADIQFHLKRIIELRASIIRGNNLLPNFSFNEFKGSSVMTFYPYLNLFPAVLISFITKSKISLLYGFFIFNTLFTFIISFYSSKNYTKAFTTSYIFSVVYSLLNVFLNYNLIYNDFGIVSSYIFLPLIIFGFLRIVQKKGGWIQLSLGMTFVLFSHILNLIIIGGFLLIYLIINIRKLDEIIVINLCKSIFLFMILTSIIWLPFLNLYFNNVNNINMPYLGQLDKINIKEFISGLYGSKNSNTIGFFPIVSMFISLFFYKKFDRYVKQMYLLSLSIILGTLFLPWKAITSYRIFNILNQFQFVNRFLIIPQMTLNFIFALIITQYINSHNKRVLLCLLTVFTAIAIQVFTGQYIIINKFSANPSVEDYIQKNGKFIDIHKIINYRINDTNQFNLLLNTYYYADDDYIPKSALPMSSYVNRNLGFYNSYHEIKVNNTGYNTLSFSGNDSINELSLPIYAYNKEKLHVYLNGKPVNNYVNKHGLLTMDNIQDNIKSSNKIYIKPALDPFRITGAILSIVGFLIILWTFIKRKF